MYVDTNNIQCMLYVFIVVAYTFSDNSMHLRNCICINPILCNMHFVYAVMHNVTTLLMTYNYCNKKLDCL